MRSKNNARLAHAPQQVRIIAGMWRGSKLPVMMRAGLRPTASRTRETLFNWLQATIPGCHCLDLFAGSGVLGFEAVSRGALGADLIEMDRQVVDVLREQARRLQATQVNILHQDALKYIAQTDQQYDVIFIDPPFDGLDLTDLLKHLYAAGMTKAHANVYIEAETGRLPTELPADWVWQRQSKAGEVEYGLIST